MVLIQVVYGGGQLTALKLDESMHRFSINCQGANKPKKSYSIGVVPDLDAKGILTRNPVGLV